VMPHRTVYLPEFGRLKENMRKSWIRISLVAVSAFAMAGVASAQSVSFWYNELGAAAPDQPGVINVVSGSSITLSVYLKTTGAGPLNGINCMFGFSTTTIGGLDHAGANRDDAGSPLANETAFAWTQSDLTTGQLFADTAGGGGPADGVSRPWGYWASTGMFDPNNTSATFANTGDGVNFHFADITLSILAPAGSDIPINIWSFPATENFASAVTYPSGVTSLSVLPSAPYTGTVHVVAVPEPASIAILGIGAAALIRRRRKK
jgi:hypothetical protein